MSGRNDPSSPDYNPQYTGESDDGDVGSGSDFGADLYFLYYAGRVSMPEAAAVWSQASTTIHGVAPYVARMAATAGELDPLIGICETLQVGFVKTSDHLRQAAEAMVVIADDYVRTDEEAEENFNLWRNELAPLEERNDLDGPTPTIPEPTRPGEPHEDLGTYPHGSLPGEGDDN